MKRIHLVLKNSVSITVIFALVTNTISSAWSSDLGQNIDIQKSQKKSLTSFQLRQLMRTAEGNDLKAAEANYKLGKNDCDGDLNTAIEYFQRAAELEHPKANYQLGKLFYEEKKDPDQAFIYLQKSIDQGQPKAFEYFKKIITNIITTNLQNPKIVLQLYENLREVLNNQLKEKQIQLEEKQKEIINLQNQQKKIPDELTKKIINLNKEISDLTEKNEVIKEEEQKIISNEISEKQKMISVADSLEGLEHELSHNLECTIDAVDHEEKESKADSTGEEYLNVPDNPPESEPTTTMFSVTELEAENEFLKKISSKEYKNLKEEEKAELRQLTGKIFTEDIYEGLTAKEKNDIQELLVNIFLEDISKKQNEGYSISDEEKKTIRDIALYLHKELVNIKDLIYAPSKINVLVGDTHAGKSTLCRWLTDGVMPSIKSEFSNSFTFKDTDETAGGVTSRTKRPKIYPINYNESYEGEIYADCPGFHDTRGILQEIRNFFYIQQLLINREVKFLLAIPEPCFNMNVLRGQKVVDAFKNLKNMIKVPDELNNKITLIVTYYKQEFNIENIKNIIKNLAEEEIDKDLSKLMLSVVDTSRIAFFSCPLSESPNYQDDEESKSEKLELLQMLKGENLSLFLQEDKLNFTLSSPSIKLLFKEMLENLAEHMKDLLKPHADAIHNYIISTRDSFKKKVDSLIQRGMKYYTPLLFFVDLNNKEDVVSRLILDLNNEENFYEKIKNGEDRESSLENYREIVMGSSFIGGGLGGTVGLAAASILLGMSPIIAGMCTVVAFLGPICGFYFYARGKWKERLTEEFIKKEGERFQLEIYDRILKLQHFKNMIFNNNFNNGSSSLGKIRSTTNLLNFIYSYQPTPNHIQKIWSDVFQTVIKDMWWSLCIDHKDLYEKKISRQLDPLYAHKNFEGFIERKFGVGNHSNLSENFIQFFIDHKDLLSSKKENSGFFIPDKRFFNLKDELKKEYPHIPEDFIKILLENKILDSDQKRGLIKTFSTEKKLNKLIHYMKLCQSVYTNEYTRTFTSRHKTPSIKEIWRKIIRKKEKINELYNTLIVLCKNYHDIIRQEATCVDIFGRQQLAIDIEPQKQLLQGRYKECISTINTFIRKIDKEALECGDLKDIDINLAQLEIIKNEIHDEYSWHFDNDNRLVDITINDDKKYPLTNQSAIAASFLLSSQLLHNKNITVLDIGFRHQNVPGGFSFKDFFLKLTIGNNPHASFDGLGEVDYIAYIEKDPAQDNSKDKLIIVYSGSNSLEDWDTNFTLGSTEHVDLCVHRGMGRLFAKSAPTYGHQLVDKVTHYYKTHRKPQKFKVVTTGHSLGGALALLCAYYYKSSQISVLSQELGLSEDKITVKTFNFGAPAIVDKDSKNNIEERMGKKNIYRVCTYQDLVVNLTEKLAFHVGRNFPLFNINNNEFSSLFDSIKKKYMSPHGAERYIHHLKNFQNPCEAVKKFLSLMNEYVGYFVDKDLQDMSETNTKNSFRNNNTVLDNDSDPSKIIFSISENSSAQNSSQYTEIFTEEDPLENFDYTNLQIPTRNNAVDLRIRNRYLNPEDLPQENYIIGGYNFKRQNVSGSRMRCFFNALGLETNIEIKKLKSKENDPIVRYIIANEIVSALHNRKDLPEKVKKEINYDLYAFQQKEVDDLVILRNQKLLEQSSDSAQQDISLLPNCLQNIEDRRKGLINDVRNRACSLNVFRSFIDYHIGNNHMMVAFQDLQGEVGDNPNANYASVDAIAYINKIGIKIYTPDSSGALRLVHQFIPEQAEEIAYLYHQGVHFQALIN